MKTVTEKYRATTTGKLAEAEFVRQMRLAYPSLITQFNGYKDTVQILQNKGMLFEEYTNPSKNLSDDAVRRGLDYELTAMGLDPAGKCSSEDLEKAKKKAIANIEKDPLHYYNLLSNESSKVDKHDKYQEVKKNNHKDTFNDMKKADLKEEVIAEGTRALVGYLAGDRLTTAYNHYDGYPSHLGKALETHYNDDEKAKDLALKGYITGIDADTGEVKSTHNDPPKKIKLPEDDEEMAREVAEQIDGMGADYGYIWDDRANRWVTIKNTGIRSMIDQVMDKMGDYAEVQEADLDETEEEYLEKRDKAIKKAMGKDVDEVLSHEQKKVVLENAISAIKKVYPELTRDIFKAYIDTHYTDLLNDPSINVADDFMEWAYINGYMDTRPDDLEEKKGKDHDGDGDVDSDDYMAAKDKAIKKAMGKDEQLKEAVKNIITRTLTEETLNEAATNDLAKIAEDYGDFEGLKPAIIALENIVTEIESFYDKTRGKIQKIYNDLGEVRNEEGLKVGAFIAPSIENAFKRDLRPITKQQFHGGLEMPKVKRISESDPVMRKPEVTQMEAPKETVFTPVNEKK